MGMWRRMLPVLPAAAALPLTWGIQAKRRRFAVNAEAPPAARRQVRAALPPAGAVGDCAKAGPLYSKLKAPPPPEEWSRLGAAILKQLAGPGVPETAVSAPPSELPPQLAVRVYHYYIPMYLWMRSLVSEVRAARGDSPGGAVVIGISAPQGCGKTTVVEVLVSLFAEDGMRCASVSIDDFYLTGAEQDKLAQSNPDVAMWKVRGNAGTHDLALGEATVRALCSPESSTVGVPVYNKAARGGKGDRTPESEWKQEKTPCDVVLFEGWMSGFKPNHDTDLSAISTGLPAINEKLKAYQCWDDLVDGWIVIALKDKNYVFDWRLQAERAMAAAGRPGMSDAGVRDFVSRYMPAYEAYCPALYEAAGAAGVDGKPTFLVKVDGTRSPEPSQ